MLDPGEQCDDGNQVGGDCCTGDCRVEQDGSVCDDHDPCTLFAACNNTGRCIGLGCDSGAACAPPGAHDVLSCGVSGGACTCSATSTPRLPSCAIETRINDEAVLREAVKRLERKGFRISNDDDDARRYFAPTLIEAAEILECDPAEWVEPTRGGP